jgi:dihydrofolate reductase
MIKIVTAMDEEGGIGKAGGIPWHSKRDFRWFRLLTSTKDDKGNQSAVIMGKTTWKSLGYKPLPNRINIVLTHDPQVPMEGAYGFDSLPKALDFAKGKTESVFVIGGAKVYREALEMDIVDELFITRIQGRFECDTKFPMEFLVAEKYKERMLFYKKAEKDLDAIWVRLYRRDESIGTSSMLVNALLQNL